MELAMKRLLMVTMVWLVFFSTGIGRAVEFQVQTGISYDWWESNKDDSGIQFHAPVQISAESDGFSFLMLTAYTYTNEDPNGGPDRTLSNLIDTKMNFSYQFLDRFPVDVLFGLDLNLPTGRTQLEQRDLELLLDPDLVSITNYGEGFNANPLVILAKQWNSWGTGVGVGYVFRGGYDYSDETLNYDPGDIFNITGEVVYNLSEKWRFSLFGEYGDLAEDQLDNQDYYQEADFYLAGLEGRYSEGPWEGSVYLQSLFRGKSRFQEGVGGILKTEDRKSYGDEWTATANLSYRLNDVTTLKTILQYLHIYENDYDDDDPLYWGERSKISFGLGVSRLLTTTVEGSINLLGWVMDDDENWYHPDDDLKYEGFSATALLTSRF
jgi:hypothetical protein